MQVSSSIGGGGSDLDGVLYDVIEAAGLASNVGSGATNYPAQARTLRMGGADASVDVGASAFWSPDGVNGLSGAYPIGTQVAAGNTTFDPRGALGRRYSHYGMPVPIGYRPSLITGGLSSLPFNYQATLECVVRKTGVLGAGSQFFFGFENLSPGNIFLGSQGALGWGISSGDASPNFTVNYIRNDPTLGGAYSGAFNTAITPVDTVTRALRLEWRVTWGTIWVAEIFIDGELILSFTDTDANWINLNQCNGTGQMFAYPTLYAGANDLAGPYYSRATVRLVAI